MASGVAWIADSKSGQTLARLVSERGPQIAAIVLLLLLGLDSALILTHVFDQPAALPAASATPPPGAARPALNPALQLAIILNSHLFGASPVSATAEARETTMPLILAGVIAGKDPAKGQAIIGQNAMAAKVYSVGGAIAGGATLHEVYADHVILERNGTMEILKLPRNAQGVGPAGASSAPPPARASGLANTNPTLLAGLVRIQPVFSQGKLSGYRIFPGGSRGNTVFSQLNLKPGDLITAVNGTPLDDAGKAMDVLQTLSSSASATVTVSRNGQPQEVNLNMASLNPDADADASGAASAAAPAASPDAISPTAMPAPSPGSPGRFHPGGVPNLGAMPGPPSSATGNMNTTPGNAESGNTPERER
jgi:general secretion pathway protein C